MTSPRGKLEKKGSWGEGGGNKAEFGGKRAWRYGREKKMT